MTKMTNLTGHGSYMVKYFGEWITAILYSHPSVKEKFFITPDETMILQYEIENYRKL